MANTNHTTLTTHRRQMIYLYAIVCVYLMLPILICIGVIPWSMKFAALVVGVVAMYIVMRILGHTHSDIGITRQRTIYSLETVLPITVALIIAAGLFLLRKTSILTNRRNRVLCILYSHLVPGARIVIPRHPQPYTTRTTATPVAGAWRRSCSFRLCTYHLWRYAHRCCYEHRRPFLVSGVSAVTERHRRNDKPRGTWCNDDWFGDY